MELDLGEGNSDGGASSASEENKSGEAPTSSQIVGGISVKELLLDLHGGNKKVYDLIELVFRSCHCL